MRLVGRPELIEEPWFASGGERAKHADELDEAVGVVDRRSTTATRWSRAFEEAQAAVAPIYDVRDVVADPQFQALGSLVRVPDPELGVGAHAERPLPALRDAGADPQRRSRPRAAHGGGAGRDRHRRRPGGRAAARRGRCERSPLVALRAGPPSRPGRARRLPRRPTPW